MQNKPTFNLMDLCFQHDVGMVRGREPKTIKWDRERKNYDGWTFYSHRTMFPTDNPDKSALMLWESEQLSQDFCPTEKVIQFSKYYKYIFTSRTELLARLPEKAKFMPSGGVWLSDDEIKIYDKPKLCSIVSSNKNMCPLHTLRMQLCQEQVCDVFGTVSGKWCEPKDYLADYAFSVVIENHIDNLYFTEKILNCFASGTIPIYVGATKISDLFNGEGIIHTSPQNVRNEIDKLSFDVYNDKKEAVRDNFERVKDYLSIEDWLFAQYKDLFV